MALQVLGDTLVGGVFHVPAGSTVADALTGEVVTMMLFNGIVVTGVTIASASKDKITYALPSAQGVSEVPPSAVAYIYVHAYLWAPRNSARSPLTIHVGDVAPELR
jgi:hypothetical protein